MLNEDYRDILQSLADEQAKFLLVGAYALAAHGFPRASNCNLPACLDLPGVPLDDVPIRAEVLTQVVYERTTA